MNKGQQRLFNNERLFYTKELQRILPRYISSSQFILDAEFFFNAVHTTPQLPLDVNHYAIFSCIRKCAELHLDFTHDYVAVSQNGKNLKMAITSSGFLELIYRTGLVKNVFFSMPKDFLVCFCKVQIDITLLSGKKITAKNSIFDLEAYFLKSVRNPEFKELSLRFMLHNLLPYIPFYRKYGLDIELSYLY